MTTTYEQGYIDTDSALTANSDNLVPSQKAFKSALAAIPFSTLTSKPTTLSGYGITDAYPLSGNPSAFLTSAPAQSFSSLTGKPTTLAGYGITDAAPKFYSGSFSQAVVAVTTFTVTIGVTTANATYKTNITPTVLLSAAVFYVTNKTTTTFDVVFLSALTGTVNFDWTTIP